jgi:hypothetical protein
MGSSDDLRQADLSGLDVTEMSEAQRSELRRRFRNFMSSLAKAPVRPAKQAEAKHVTKWTPTKRVEGRRSVGSSRPKGR